MSTGRQITGELITATVCRLFLKANTCLGADVEAALRVARDVETGVLGRQVLDRILENALIAREERLPICQDTGLAVVFVELGQDVRIVGGSLREAIEAGVRQAYGEGFFRKSVCDPLSRANTQDNTPAVIHMDMVPGDRIRLVAMPKGGGSENMSTVTMLLPAVGREGIRDHVVETVLKAGPNPCPPVIVGVGIGGAMEEAVIMAKKSLLRPLGERNSRDVRLALLEAEILDEVNRRGGGPQGFGGVTTALAVHVEMKPCHIASLPVAVNIQCHAARHCEALL
ncbi:MAG TPA: fumarate hydratase [Syntrophales bacterium]|jgi:fumarate hydratase subunit alpha|nr:fumarate hydratase [Syntrophales bacterium]HOU78159.1 fumarate hydratase [Syntrophales bacterium]HPC33074.1 fumarate hydratase [Syntrophales bacterium]HQG34495.1 fumarate hydratase [Syntrophales bacterium]HQI35952.1 fumarate hydratase [Syntrophales bacterium]